jgi:hypothetical protein
MAWMHLVSAETFTLTHQCSHESPRRRFASKEKARILVPTNRMSESQLLSEEWS